MLARLYYMALKPFATISSSGSSHAELSEFYFAFFVRNFATGLIGIFEPIYLYLFFDKSLSLTLLYFAISALLHGVFSPLGARVAARFGEKHAMLYSVPFLFLYYIVLWKINAFPMALVGIALLLRTAHDALFWPAFHLDFLRISNHGSRGREFSSVMVSSSAAIAVAPFFGGVILSVPGFGFPVLFASVLVLLVVSALILLRTQDVRDHIEESYGKTWSLVFSKHFWRQGLAFFGQGGETGILMYVWPVFLFVIAFSYANIGILGSVSSLVGLFTISFLGRLTDAVHYKKLLSVASAGLAAIWILKALTRSHPALFALHTVEKLVGPGAGLPFMAIVYERASQEAWHRVWFIIFREIMINMGRAAVLSFLALFFLFSDQLQVSFYIAALFVLLLNVI